MRLCVARGHLEGKQHRGEAIPVDNRNVMLGK
jgi:hypothetical protein